MKKPHLQVAYVFQMCKVSLKMLFFESRDTEVFKADRNKLFVSKASWQSYLNAWHALATHTYQLSVPTIVEVSLEVLFSVAVVFLLIFVVKKAT